MIKKVIKDAVMQSQKPNIRLKKVLTGPPRPSRFSFKALATEDTLLRTQLLPTQMFPCLPAHATFFADTKNVSDFVQKHFVSATNVSQFVQPKKHHGQQRVRNNVSSFTRAFRERDFLFSLAKQVRAQTICQLN